MVTGVIGYLLDGKCNLKWLSFGLSELVSLLGVTLAVNSDGTGFLVRVIIGLLNGTLIFATALGINTISTKPTPQEAETANRRVNTDALKTGDIVASSPILADYSACASKETKKITAFITKDRIHKIVKPKFFLVRW